MNDPAAHRISPPARSLRRALLNLLLMLVVAVRAGLPAAERAYAAEPVVCTITSGCPTDTTFPPPELLYLTQGGLYAATPAQVASLRSLENQAVQTVIDLHSLPAEDEAAVRTWGRDDVLAQLYILLNGAIATDAAQRTADQQNAVDWLTTVAKRENVAAAEAAAREYVKWAGLGRLQFDSLLASNPTRAQLEAFLSRPVVNYDNTDLGLATEGWCKYRSPAPYASEYEGYNNPLCSGPVLGFILPPTPSYDQFVKWGEAKAKYPLLNSPAFLNRAQTLGIALGIGLPLSTVVAGIAPTVVALRAVSYFAAIADIDQVVSTSTIFSVATRFSVLTGASVALVVIAALVTAILLGVNVTDAANLPGKLATLVDTARTTSIDASTLTGDSDSATSLLSLFVGATTPAPSLSSCDNALGLAPGMYPLTVIGSDETTLTSSTPCLNPTRIPEAAATDPQFVVKSPSGAEALAPAISVKDAASSSVTTVRMSGNWFVTTANGTTAQTLRIAYTDWAGTQQNAWLVGNPSAGYTFMTFAPPADSTTTLDSTACVESGACGFSESIAYLGADGQHYSATVRAYQAPTGTPTVSSASESSPAVLDANGFAPGGAVAPVTYRWSFKGTDCALYLDVPCPELDSATGAAVTYTWDAGGTYQVDLTATDAVGAQATATLQVPVATLPPALALAPDCAASPSVPCNTWSGSQGSSVAVRSTMRYTGSASRFQITVDWGDGSTYFATLGSDGTVGTIPPGGVSPLTITRVPGELAYTILAPHTYASPGVYSGSITVKKVVGLFGDGGTATRPFTMSVKGSQAISFPNIGGRSYGDVFSISATGGASGQPVTFTATSGCALSNVTGGAGTGSATVTVLGSGFCDITASQAGSATYTPAPDVRQRVVALLAPLTVTAPSPTIVYGQPVPALTPTYSGFKLSDTAATLTAPATCAVAGSGGAPGTYAVTCSGAAAPSYSVSYEPGTLTIARASTTTTLSPSPSTSVIGQPTTFTAAVAVVSPGSGKPSGTVAFTDGGAPIAGCSAQPLDTATGTATCTTALALGAHTIGATYGGDANVTGSAASLSHRVAYRWSGFLQPVDNLPTVNTLKAGSAVAVKFSLSGSYGLGIFAAGYPTVQGVSCSSGAPTSEIEQTVAAGGSSLSYDAATGQYSYTWKTDRSWAGSCRLLTIRLSDGTDHSALFQLR